MSSSRPQPIYREPGVDIWFADTFGLLRSWGGGMRHEGLLFDITTTDLPYDSKTLKGARKQGSGGPERLIDGHFAAFTVAQAREALRLCGTVTRSWVIATMDIEHLRVLRDEPPFGLEFIRDGVWVKSGAAPQFSGDRPAMGWEAIGIFHVERAKGERTKWNGGGRNAVFEHGVVRGEKNPTAKPVPLMRELISLFCPEGGSVLDPFMGTGATARAAKDLKREFTGIDADREYLDDAIARLRQEVLPGLDG